MWHGDEVGAERDRGSSPRLIAGREAKRYRYRATSGTRSSLLTEEWWNIVLVDREINLGWGFRLASKDDVLSWDSEHDTSRPVRSRGGEILGSAPLSPANQPPITLSQGAFFSRGTSNVEYRRSKLNQAQTSAGVSLDLQVSSQREWPTSTHVCIVRGIEPELFRCISGA